MDNNYTVYVHISPSGKKYVGITKQDPETRWRKNGNGYKENPRFYNAIKKYGWDKFQHVILHSGISCEEAKLYEVRYIEKYNSADRRYGYNRSPGGDLAAPITDETRRRLSASHIGKCCGEKNGFYGKNFKEFLGRERYEKWLASRPHNGKEVICITTNEVFESLTEAAKQYNTSLANIICCCTRRTCFAGRHPDTGEELVWQYYDDYISGIRPKENGVVRPVRCITTGDEFGSIKEAAITYGVKPGGITKCCKGKSSYCGVHCGNKLKWEYIPTNIDVKEK